MNTENTKLNFFQSLFSKILWIGCFIFFSLYYLWTHLSPNTESAVIRMLYKLLFKMQPAAEDMIGFFIMNFLLWLILYIIFVIFFPVAAKKILRIRFNLLAVLLVPIILFYIGGTLITSLHWRLDIQCNYTSRHLFVNAKVWRSLFCKAGPNSAGRNFPFETSYLISSFKNCQ